jgi:NAD(P)-dependent dehydrogenase (short-subunit alcohol dehydrogenase family)
MQTAFLPENYVPAADLLADRVVLVTGAAQGLGRAAALAFAKHGATVILHGRDIARLESVYDEIEHSGGKQPAIMPLDFLKTSQPELDGFAQTIHSTFGRLDGIFHSASHFAPPTPLALQDLDVWNQHALVNLSVPAALTKACLPLLARSTHASVVFLTETHAVEPRAFWGAFAATKCALSPLAVIWNQEMGDDAPVRFNVCLPGPVASPMRNKSHPAEAKSLLRTPDDLDRDFLFLMGPDSRHLGGALYCCESRDGH